MIYTDRRVNASGPRNARLAAIGMAPAKWEIADGKPFSGLSGRVFNDCLDSAKTTRASVFVTNMCSYFIDDNDLYSMPLDLFHAERARVFKELDEVKPNCLLIMGGDTLDLLTAKDVYQYTRKKDKKLVIGTKGAKQGVQKWRGSVFQLELPSGRAQKCVVSMHPASFLRGQWKWLQLYKYIDVPRAVTQSSSAEMKLTSRSAITGPSFRQAREWLATAALQEWVSVDYEGRGHITCLGSGWTSHEAMCIPLSRVGSSRYWTLEEEMEIWRLWSYLLQKQSVRKVAQNAAFEWIKSWLYGIYPTPLGLDTMLAHHCLYPDFGGINDEWSRKKRDIDNPGHGLGLITSQYTDQPFYKDDGRHWEPSMGEESFWRYNCLDVMVTMESGMKMKAELEQCSLWPAYQRNYLDSFEHALRFEWIGTPIDVARRARALEEETARLATLCSELQDLTGYKVITKAKKGEKPKAGVLNLASPAQVLKWLTHEKKYHVGVNRKTGQPTVDKDMLAALAIKHNDESLVKIQEVKKIQDLINDVLTQPLDANNNIHCHMKLGGTNATRRSTTESILGSGTNLQNLPRVGVARSLFTPD